MRLYVNVRYYVPNCHLNQTKVRPISALLKYSCFTKTMPLKFLYKTYSKDVIWSRGVEVGYLLLSGPPREGGEMPPRGEMAAEPSAAAAVAAAASPAAAASRKE